MTDANYPIRVLLPVTVVARTSSRVHAARRLPGAADEYRTACQATYTSADHPIRIAGAVTCRRCARVLAKGGAS